VPGFIETNEAAIGPAHREPFYRDSPRRRVAICEPAPAIIGRSSSA
jgi:hypothetical protein